MSLRRKNLETIEIKTKKEPCSNDKIPSDRADVNI